MKNLKLSSVQHYIAALILCLYAEPASGEYKVDAYKIKAKSIISGNAGEQDVYYKTQYIDEEDTRHRTIYDVTWGIHSGGALELKVVATCQQRDVDYENSTYLPWYTLYTLTYDDLLLPTYWRVGKEELIGGKVTSQGEDVAFGADSGKYLSLRVKARTTLRTLTDPASNPLDTAHPLESVSVSGSPSATEEDSGYATIVLNEDSNATFDVVAHFSGQFGSIEIATTYEPASGSDGGGGGGGGGGGKTADPGSGGAPSAGSSGEDEDGPWWLALCGLAEEAGKQGDKATEAYFLAYCYYFLLVDENLPEAYLHYYYYLGRYYLYTWEESAVGRYYYAYYLAVAHFYYHMERGETREAIDAWTFWSRLSLNALN